MTSRANIGTHCAASLRLQRCLLLLEGNEPERKRKMTTFHPTAREILTEVTIDELSSVGGGFVESWYEPGYQIRDANNVGVTFTDEGIYWKTSTGKVGFHPF